MHDWASAACGHGHGKANERRPCRRQALLLEVPLVMRQLDRLPVHIAARCQLVQVAHARLGTERGDLAPELALRDLHADAAGRFERRVHGASEAGQGQGFGAAALVELLLPDDVVGLFGALAEHLGLDALQDGAGVGAGALAHAGLDVAAAVARDGALEHLIAARPTGQVAVAGIQVAHHGRADARGVVLGGFADACANQLSALHGSVLNDQTACEGAAVGRTLACCCRQMRRSWLRWASCKKLMF